MKWLLVLARRSLSLPVIVCAKKNGVGAAEGDGWATIIRIAVQSVMLLLVR